MLRRSGDGRGASVRAAWKRYRIALNRGALNRIAPSVWRAGALLPFVSLFLAASGLTLSIDSPAAYAESRSWRSEGDRVRHVVVTLYKSRTFQLDQPFSTAVVGSPEIVDALPMSDRSIYIQGKKVGTTNVSVFDNMMRLMGVLDVEV